MESVGAILGLGMIVFGLLMLTVCLGTIVYLYWPRSADGVGPGGASPQAVADERPRKCCCCSLKIS